MYTPIKVKDFNTIYGKHWVIQLSEDQRQLTLHRSVRGLLSAALQTYPVRSGDCVCLADEVEADEIEADRHDCNPAVPAVFLQTILR